MNNDQNDRNKRHEMKIKILKRIENKKVEEKGK